MLFGRVGFKDGRTLHAYKQLGSRSSSRLDKLLKYSQYADRVDHAERSLVGENEIPDSKQ